MGVLPVAAYNISLLKGVRFVAVLGFGQQYKFRALKEIISVINASSTPEYSSPSRHRRAAL